MAELSAVPFSALPQAGDGYTVLYDDNQVCRSEKKLSELVGDKTSSFLTKEQGDSLYQEKGDYLVADDITGKLDKSQYAVDSATFLTAHQDISNKLDTTAFSTVSSNFLTAHQSLDGYATQEWVNNKLEEDYYDVENTNELLDKKLDVTAFSTVSGNFITSADLDNYYTKSEIDSKFGFRECEVEEDADVEPRDIWIAFKFFDKNYNPQEHNLAIGTVESNGQNRAFKADWQLVNETENIWMWGVTEGTNLSLAFRYGGGEKSFPLLVSDNYRDIPEEMWRQEKYSSLEAILADCDKWWLDYVKSGEVQYTGAVEIYDWDLSQATALDHIFGDNPYWRCAIVGTLPDLNSNASHAVYMFGRLYDITSVGKITLPNLNGDIQKMLYAMTSLQDIPVLDLNGNPQNLDMLFWQDCNVSKSSIENTYDYLNTNFGSLSHNNTFKQCGLYKDPTALDNIPASWGGNLV